MEYKLEYKCDTISVVAAEGQERSKRVFISRGWFDTLIDRLLLLENLQVRDPYFNHIEVAHTYVFHGFNRSLANLIYLFTLNSLFSVVVGMFAGKPLWLHCCQRARSIHKTPIVMDSILWTNLMIQLKRKRIGTWYLYHFLAR